MGLDLGCEQYALQSPNPSPLPHSISWIIKKLEVMSVNPDSVNSYKNPETRQSPSLTLLFMVCYMIIHPECNIKHIPHIVLIIPPLPEGGGGILFYLCPSFRPSKIFFVAFFSVTVDGRNLIFGHKRHIGIPYCG